MESTTIAAIATAMSASGISIIRISGPDALQVIDAVYKSPKGKKKISSQKSHTIHYGYIYDGEDLIDEVVVLLMKAPNSYTAEDTVEIDCHGGLVVTKRILETVLKNGAVIAAPGEFTKRAFLNGRIDLSKAEAVMDLIDAQNRYAADSAVHQLKGTVSEKVNAYRDEILDQLAFLESALDDPEHFELDGFGVSLEEKIEQLLADMEQLLQQSKNGRIVTEGIHTVILGRPNAGKSSLLNLLAGEERAIVTDIAGTTRDLLQETVRLGDISFILTDTAGIRESDNVVEQIGVSKAMDASHQADLILYVIDSSQELSALDSDMEQLIAEKNSVIILNKTDLQGQVSIEEVQNRFPGKPVCRLSALEGTGLQQLESMLKEMFLQGNIDFNNQIILSNLRQQEALSEAMKSLGLVQKSIADGMTEDFYAIDLMDAYTSLGKIIGASVEDDLVDRIFAKFCMGK